ncbi:hypothetical protein BBK82_00265 [Lentzea guizhouensis]|uniref:Uncharacterized protein n=1 Tax=Lentzea guizhouensis TaxID=1586287 RepID=A0A1B2HAK1_9PSEU|nr:hypothetical protein [Lentzea guizhouensis]ANZ34744.1 hypothetical protein BBK82_00265 [Lentzea guizhouensis]
MEPDLDGLLEIAVDALDEHERGQVLAWLAGAVIGSGHTERLARGARDVVLLLPDRLVVVRPDPFQSWSYPRELVVSALFAADHAQFEVADEHVKVDWEFWIDKRLTESSPFIKAVEAWLVQEKQPGKGGLALGLLIMTLIIGGLYFAGGGSGPSDGPLNARSTCSEFLFAGADEQLAILTKLFKDAGKEDEAKNPTALRESGARCEQNGTATLDTLVGNR